MAPSQEILVAVDAIVFGYTHKQLYVLLIQRKYGRLQGQWALPGGFVHTNEGLKTAVKRELMEETGVELNYLEQLYTFGDQVDRDPRGRVISVAYFGLVDSLQTDPKADTDAKDVKWFPLTEVPTLAFDHNHIVEVAFKRLQNKLSYQPIGFDLLGVEFPFSDLEQLYMTILQRKIDRRNFRKKILSFGFLEETGNVLSEGRGKPAKLFRFNPLKYRALEESGFHFEIKFA